MCNPAAFVMGGAGLVSGGIENGAQNAKRDFEKTMYKRTVTEANKDSFEAYTALQERDVQETAAATDSIKQASMASKQVVGATVTSAADQGISGNTVVQLVDDVGASEAEYVGSIIRNRVWSQRQLQRQADAIRGETYQKILGALPRTPKSNWLNIALKGISGATSGLSMGAAS